MAHGLENQALLPQDVLNARFGWSAPIRGVPLGAVGGLLAVAGENMSRRAVVTVACLMLAQCSAACTGPGRAAVPALHAVSIRSASLLHTGELRSG
jgi:hypothetical protein